MFKKFIIILVACICLGSCTDGKSVRIKMKAGDMRYTETSEYIIVEKCANFDGFGTPQWKFVRVIRKESDVNYIDLDSLTECVD